jgi:hypothetical protein
MFAALQHGDGVIIAQARIPDDTAEATQVKALLDAVDLTGAVVTADATHASRETAACIAGERGADYLLTVKVNTLTRSRPQQSARRVGPRGRMPGTPGRCRTAARGAGPPWRSGRP